MLITLAINLYQQAKTAQLELGNYSYGAIRLLNQQYFQRIQEKRFIAVLISHYNHQMSFNLNTRLPQAIKRFHTTLQRLQQQSPAQPLLMVREPEPLGYVTTIKRAPYSDLISRFSLKEISRKEEGFE
jgi:hypothetical protein